MLIDWYRVWLLNKIDLLSIKPSTYPSSAIPCGLVLSFFLLIMMISVSSVAFIIWFGCGKSLNICVSWISRWHGFRVARFLSSHLGGLTFCKPDLFVSLCNSSTRNYAYHQRNIIWLLLVTHAYTLQLTWELRYRYSYATILLDVYLFFLSDCKQIKNLCNQSNRYH